MNTQKAPTIVAYAFAAAFLLATIMGYVPNPLVGPDALFETNAAHNMVHLVTAVAFAAVAYVGSRASIRFMLGFGVVYLLVGAVGFAVTSGGGQGMLLGLVHINTLDNFLHLGLGAGILGAGLILRRQQTVTSSDGQPSYS